MYNSTQFWAKLVIKECLNVCAENFFIFTLFLNFLISRENFWESRHKMVFSSWSFELFWQSSKIFLGKKIDLFFLHFQITDNWKLSLISIAVSSCFFVKLQASDILVQVESISIIPVFNLIFSSFILFMIFWISFFSKNLASLNSLFGKNIHLESSSIRLLIFQYFINPFIWEISVHFVLCVRFCFFIYLSISFIVISFRFSHNFQLNSKIFLIWL